jgi:hypothetical protein
MRVVVAVVDILELTQLVVRAAVVAANLALVQPMVMLELLILVVVVVLGLLVVDSVVQAVQELLLPVM